MLKYRVSIELIQTVRQIRRKTKLNAANAKQTYATYSFSAILRTASIDAKPTINAVRPAMTSSIEG